MKTRFGFIITGILASSILMQACGSDDDNINNLDQWIGAPCTCEGKNCEQMSVPLPSPKDALIKGCGNIDMTGVTGGQLACLRTIEAKYSSVAPTVYAPQGYCTISAVKAEMEKGKESLASLASYGDTDSFTACPAGSALLSSKFNYKILGFDAVITNKTCAKICKSDSDCNVDGDMKCMEKDGLKFCYNDVTFAVMQDTCTVTAF